RTSGFEAARDRALAAGWDDLERESGAARDRMQAFARLLVERPNAVLIWSMGLTQHTHGVETIKALVNVGLARGLPGRANRGLVPPRLRIHHDIVVSSSMLLDGEGDVVLLPAATRYESPGGGSETSTERRIIFSPEIPGRRIGSARPEWWAFGEAMARAFPDRAAAIRFESAQQIRDEIARAVPLYSGIETLRAKGDQVQWGGRTLYADGGFATPDGKAHFAAVSLRGSHVGGDAVEGAAEGGDPGRRFRLSTRRGKQFNSMVQREID